MKNKSFLSFVTAGLLTLSLTPNLVLADSYTNVKGGEGTNTYALNNRYNSNDWSQQNVTFKSLPTPPKKKIIDTKGGEHEKSNKNPNDGLQHEVTYNYLPAIPQKKQIIKGWNDNIAYYGYIDNNGYWNYYQDSYGYYMYLYNGNYYYY